MKRNYKILLILLIAAGALWGFSAKKITDPNKEKLILQVVTYVLERGHYAPKDIDDKFSETIFNNFLDATDPYKRFLTEEDVKELTVFKDQIDDQIKQSDLTFFDQFYAVLNKRIEESKGYYKDILSTPFDYTKDDTYHSDYDKIGFAKNKAELKDRWRQQLKFSALSSYYDLIEDQKENVKKDKNLKLKSNDELEKQARETVLKNTDEFYDSIDEIVRDDWFYVYVNLIAEAFDPHTNYLSPQGKDLFDTDMSGKYFGIGARLQKKDGDVNIVELISGGPAWRNQELEVGDVILKVAQGDEEPVSILGMRLDDAIKLIKGPENTEVKLTVRRIDGSQKVISIIREEIELEETYVKSAIIQDGGKKYGIINLPKFYVDFDDPKGRTAAKDVKAELERFKKQGVEGLILDLRNNGGGSLQTVVEMAGLFIESGPIVQVKDAGKRKNVLEDKDKSITWDGPLVIMVNELSASASEILAAAMQDYHRAVIIGSKQTYGKGTVQQVYGLQDILNDASVGDIGALKMTIQKFYRVNGGSTQLEGVKSDIVIPDRYSYIDIGEKDSENPLQWDKIDSANYKPWNKFGDINQIVTLSNNRIVNNPDIKFLDEQAKYFKSQRDDNQIPLNFDAYIAKIKSNKETTNHFKALEDYRSGLTFSSLPYEIQLFEKDSTLLEKRKRWHLSLTKDIYVAESVNVLKDLNEIPSIPSKIAAIKN